MRARWIRIALALLSVSTAGLGCESGAAGPTPVEEVRPRSEPVEFVGLTFERRVESEADIVALLDPLFGDAASRGAGHTRFEVEPGIFLTSAADTRSAEQGVVVMEMTPSRVEGAEARTILRVPVGYEYGRVFLDAVRVAYARAATVTGRGETMQPFYLEYRVRSQMGGDLRVVASYDDRGARVTVSTNTPQTSLRPGDINTPAFGGDPYEVLAGTVLFELSRDEFAFFSNRAYGVTAGAAQNFEDFQLLPHDWLRLTVTPQLEDERVDVAFEVLTTDGRRVPFARAPASLVAGAQFQDNVYRMVDNMLAQEAAEPGSSNAWEVPFHYDDPAGGGVVRVVATGERGVFRIAYAVESPVRRLSDVEFVPYQTVVEIPDVLTPPETTCADVGSVEALRGRFRIRFDASSTVRESDALAHPLRGRVWGSVYRAEDVTLAGPRDGAEPVASFDYADVDVTAGQSTEYALDAELAAGDYQILGFMDIDGNGAETGDPDEGDPVTLPIGGYPLSCESQPVVVEFALLLPPGR